MKKKKYKENFFLYLLFAIFIFLEGLWHIYQASQGQRFQGWTSIVPMDTWQRMGLGIVLITGALYLWRYAIKENKKGDSVILEKEKSMQK